MIKNNKTLQINFLFLKHNKEIKLHKRDKTTQKFKCFNIFYSRQTFFNREYFTKKNIKKAEDQRLKIQ